MPNLCLISVVVVVVVVAAAAAAAAAAAVVVVVVVVAAAAAAAAPAAAAVVVVETQKIVRLAWRFQKLLQCIITKEQLTHCDETKKRAHDSQIVRA